MVDPKQMQDRCLHVMDVDRIAHDIPRKVIRLAKDAPAFDSSTRLS